MLFVFKQILFPYVKSILKMILKKEGRIKVCRNSHPDV